MGVLGLQRLFPGVPIKGRVIVCADNGTKTYPLFPQFVNEEHFSHAHKVAPVKIKDPKIKLCELPVEIKDRDVIHKVWCGSNRCKWTCTDWILIWFISRS